MKEVIQIPLTSQEIMAAIAKARSTNFIDNLRERNPNVAFDNKLRGYVGETAFLKWGNQNGINFNSHNSFKEETGIDIDFTYITKNRTLDIELKTSLIPDVDEILPNVLCKRDIKLIKRGNEAIEQLKSDIHVQMFFKQLRLRKDEWLKKQLWIDSKESDEAIYFRFAAERYKKDVYMVGWIDKTTLKKQIDKKDPKLRTWQYGMREFWTCNLEKEAREVSELKSFLKSLNKKSHM